MGLSSNIIWHQTDFKGLKAILESKSFCCSYSLEDIRWKSSCLQRAFPMISFCNIPISDLSEYLTNNETNEYTGKYGKYTIGLKQNWGFKNGVSPVWYHNPQSLSLHEIMNRHSILQSKDWGEPEILLWRLLSHIKNHEGSLTKYKFKSYRFYDEKEIRYVPDYSTLKDKDIPCVLTPKEYDNYKSTHNRTALMPQFKLPFDINDIVYILISSSSQKHRIIELLGNASKNVIILSYQQIIEDIIGLEHTRL